MRPLGAEAAFECPQDVDASVLPGVMTLYAVTQIVRVDLTPSLTVVSPRRVGG
jgi:hypothetical protein